MTSVQPMQDTPKEKKSKWRLSNLVKKDHNKDTANDNVAPPQDNDYLGPDSAYGGSDTMNSTESSAEQVPTISKAQAISQGAPTKTHVDQRGRTITTTTTTTTTTVTTLDGSHMLVPAGKEVVVSKEEAPTELSARPLSTGSTENLRQQAGSPQIPQKDKRRSKSPIAPLSVSQNNSHRLSGPTGEPSMPLSPGHQNFSYPARTPPPPQQSFSPVSPQGRYDAPSQQAGHTSVAFSSPTPVFRSTYHDTPDVPSLPSEYAQQQGNNRYSYGSEGQGQGQQQQQAYRTPQVPQNSSRPRPPVDPSHGQPRLNGEPSRDPLPYNRESNGQQPQSTLQSLKIAAAGIHGAGETLRGALNTQLERRTGGSAQSIAAHEAVMERGRQEIETGHYIHSSSIGHHPSNAGAGYQSSDAGGGIDQGEEYTVPPKEGNQRKSRGLRNVLRKKSRSRDGLGRVPE